MSSAPIGSWQQIASRSVDIGATRSGTAWVYRAGASHGHPHTLSLGCRARVDISISRFDALPADSGIEGRSATPAADGFSARRLVRPPAARRGEMSRRVLNRSGTFGDGGAWPSRHNRPRSASGTQRHQNVLDLMSEDGQLNVHGGKADVRPPGAPTVDKERGLTAR
jgi:hypothetical protein